MEPNSNPAGSEEYEVSVSRGFRHRHDRMFGFERTAQPDCAKGGGLRCWFIGGYVSGGGSRLVWKTSRLRSGSRRDVQTSSGKSTGTVDGFNRRTCMRGSSEHCAMGA